MEQTPSFLTIDTSTNTIKTYEPLPVFNSKNPHLTDRLAEYDFVHSNLSIEQLKEIVKRMEATMLKHGGIGLAANQVGLKIRMFVMTGETVTACINPSILKRSETFKREREGCITFPYLFLPIERPEWVDVEWFDIFGVVQKARFSGLTARVFCHELDHLNGIVYTSYVGNLTLQMAKKKRDKMIKKIARMTELKQAQKV
jgi:peptide deformylase